MGHRPWSEVRSLQPFVRCPDAVADYLARRGFDSLAELHAPKRDDALWRYLLAPLVAIPDDTSTL